MSLQFVNGSNTISLNASPSGNRTVTLPNKGGTIALTSQMPSVPPSVSGYVTQTYRSGSNWYRRWNDGFIEQGGECGNSGNQSFVTSFSNTNSIFVMRTGKSGGHTNDFYVIFNPVSTSQFNVNCHTRYGSFEWYAAGY